MAKQRQEDGKKGVVDLMPLFAKELLAGGVAGGFAKTVVAPLQHVKILFQVPSMLSFLPYFNNPYLFLFSFIFKIKMHLLHINILL